MGGPGRRRQRIAAMRRGLACCSAVEEGVAVVVSLVVGLGEVSCQSATSAMLAVTGSERISS